MYINHEVYNFEKYVDVFGMTEICQQGAIFEVDLCIYIWTVRPIAEDKAPCKPLHRSFVRGVIN